jgi:hypothetical protein
MISKPLQDKSILLELVEKAIEAGASEMEIEYKDGREQVFAVAQGIGIGIASLDSKSGEARLLRQELYGMAKKRKMIRLPGVEYVLRVQVFDSFGEDAFHIIIKTS